MKLLWGLIVLSLSLLAWGSQFISWISPRSRPRFALTNAENPTEPSYWVDIRGEAPFATVTLWTMVAAGALLIFDLDAWAYFGLVGGGMYVYFAGGAIFNRIAAQREGIPVGTHRKHRTAYAMLVAWGLMGLVTIAAAVVSLQGS